MLVITHPLLPCPCCLLVRHSSSPSSPSPSSPSPSSSSPSVVLAVRHAGCWSSPCVILAVSCPRHRSFWQSFTLGIRHPAICRPCCQSSVMLAVRDPHHQSCSPVAARYAVSCACRLSSGLTVCHARRPCGRRPMSAALLIFRQLAWLLFVRSMSVTLLVVRQLL